MADIIKKPSFKDIRGDLFVIEKFLSFEIKRVYFLKKEMESEEGISIRKLIRLLFVLKAIVQ